MSAVNPRLARVADTMWLLTTRHGSFGTMLGLILPADGGRLRYRQLDDRQSVVTAPWPAWAARKDGALCLATALALHDEISTYGGMACWDARHRPGVSISIAGQLVGRGWTTPSVEPDEELSYVTRRLKAGRVLGYLELEIWRGEPGDSSSELLAVGRHSKAMEMPLSGAQQMLYRAVSHPSVFPRVQPLLQRWLEGRPVAPWPSAAARAECFPALQPADGNDQLGGDTALFSVPGAGATQLYSAALRPQWANAIGTLHGGAACILGEHAAATAYRAAEGGAPGEAAPPARALAVNLLSGLVCDGRHARVAAAIAASGPEGASPMALATLSHQHDRGRGVECAVWF